MLDVSGWWVGRGVGVECKWVVVLWIVFVLWTVINVSE